MAKLRFRPYFLFKRGFKGQPPPPIVGQVRDRWTKSICRRPLRGGPLDILGGGVSDPKKKFMQEIELEKKISACA